MDAAVCRGELERACDPRQGPFLSSTVGDDRAEQWEVRFAGVPEHRAAQLSSESLALFRIFYRELVIRARQLAAFDLDRRACPQRRHDPQHEKRHG